MKILLAPDKFRGSLDAPQVCEAMTEGIRMVSPEIEVVSLPMADGGEGTLDLLLWYSGGKKQTAKDIPTRLSDVKGVDEITEEV